VHRAEDLSRCYSLCVNIPVQQASARRAIRSKPGFSISYMMLAAALSQLGRSDEAKAAAERVLQLQPNFSSNGQCIAVGAVPALAAPLVKAMRAAALPE
jgi:adenylate cyclase